MNKPMEMDLRDFERELKLLVSKATPEAIEQGLGRAGLQLLTDAVIQEPTAPLDEGWLRGSASLFVGGKKKAVPPKGRKGKEANSDDTRQGKGDNIAVAGFNVPYAARLHEEHWTPRREKSSGRKYLEKKLIGNRQTYFKIMANALKGIIG